MIDLEREQLRKTYEVTRTGFWVMGAALAIACVTSLLPVLEHFYPVLVHRIWASSFFQWLDMPITWGCLLGVTLLWGRFDHPGWQRRVGLLLAMSMVDAMLWFLTHGKELGLNAAVGHAWLRANVGAALGWAEFALIAGISCEYLEHLGVEYARESGKSTRSMAATGAVVWLLLFCQRTNWAAWPLIPNRPRSLEELLLEQATHLIWAITLIQVTSLCLSAARMTGKVLEDMAFEDAANDPLKPNSEEWARELDARGV